ncbi:MAG: beta galactosidase jelly roll domain-containing protein [Bacteroidales bacterium]|nr:beta galactosidase jelly roll domain-containing protein [Bacteroidales bacterium]
MLYRIEKFFLLLIYFIICITGCAGKQEDAEQKQLFDLNWKFYQGDITSAIEFDFNDGNWRNLDLPHDWSIDERLSQKNSTKDKKDTFITGVGWYRKKFILPSDWENKRVTIYFEGINEKTKIFLNENLIEKKSKSSDPFHFDLTPYLNSDKKNIIAVRVNNSPQADGRWPKGTGLPRHVWLLVTDPV